MKTISCEQVLKFHSKLIARTGGIDGVRNLGLIQSALERHRQTFDGKDLYNSVVEKIAVTTVSLVCNHGFVDGNKRIGISMMLLLLKYNEFEIIYTQEELITLGLELASGIIRESEVIEWIENHKK